MYLTLILKMPSKPLNFKLELPLSDEYKAVNINLKTLHKEVHDAESSR